MEDEIARFSLSIYKSDLQRINKFAEKNKQKFNSQAEIFRHIIREFLNDVDKHIKKDFIIHFIYPVLIGALASFGTVSTQKLIDILFKQDIYFAELHNLNRVFVILGALSIGLFIANLYWFFKKQSN